LAYNALKTNEQYLFDAPSIDQVFRMNMAKKACTHSTFSGQTELVAYSSKIVSSLYLLLYIFSQDRAIASDQVDVHSM
jgi:hypothetical protein